MAKGGARARSGPAPDPNALRRDRDEGEWTVLPAAGRDGDAPCWPLSEASPRELELWDREWRRPQAIVWDRNGQAVEVALYVRNLVDAESPRATTASRNLTKQHMEMLGLTAPGMRALRWKIEPAEAAVEKPAPTGRPSARQRLEVLEGGRSA